MAALPRLIAALALALFVASCSTAGLSPGLTARLDHTGATLDRGEALGIINQYRLSTGRAGLAPDAALDARAQELARQYATTGKPPARPDGSVEIRFSAGYFTFAETFSGWRNSPADAAGLASAQATRAGLGGYYSENSPYGAYWVLLLE